MANSLVSSVISFFSRSSKKVEHQCVYRHVIAVLEHAPVGEQNHTSYMIFSCKCGNAIMFPEENFNLTTEEHQSAVKKQLEESGYKLVLNK